MLSLFNYLQLVLAVAVALTALGRSRVLFYEAPAGAAFMRALRAMLQEGEREGLRVMAAEAAPSWPARAVRLVLDASSWRQADLELSGLIADLRFEATKHLGALRVCATIASTTGLLGAILELAGGFSAGGLVALKAGAAEAMALRAALLTMALGLGLSGFCFYALGLLRGAALEAIREVTQTARLLEQAFHEAEAAADDPAPADSWRAVDQAG